MPSSSSYPDLERKPGKSNWVDEAGGLPSYIERIAKHLHYEEGMTISHAIASAVNTVKRWCKGGTVSKTGGPEGGSNVSAKTKTQACAALAEWNAKKGKAGLSLGMDRDAFSDGDFIDGIANQVEVGWLLSQSETPLDQSAYQLALSQKRREAGILDTSSQVGYTLNMTIFKWDPHDHPRDLLGKFAKKLGSMQSGGKVMLPDGVTVTKQGDRYRVGIGDVTTPSSFKKPESAAKKALDYSAAGKHPDSLGGDVSYGGHTDVVPDEPFPRGQRVSFNAGDGAKGKGTIDEIREKDGHKTYIVKTDEPTYGGDRIQIDPKEHKLTRIHEDDLSRARDNKFGGLRWKEEEQWRKDQHERVEIQKMADESFAYAQRKLGWTWPEFLENEFGDGNVGETTYSAHSMDVKVTPDGKVRTPSGQTFQLEEPKDENPLKGDLDLPAPGGGDDENKPSPALLAAGEALAERSTNQDAIQAWRNAKETGGEQELLRAGTTMAAHIYEGEETPGSNAALVGWGEQKIKQEERQRIRNLQPGEATRLYQPGSEDENWVVRAQTEPVGKYVVTPPSGRAYTLDSVDEVLADEQLFPDGMNESPPQAVIHTDKGEYRWHGGATVNIYDKDGKEVDVFTMGGTDNPTEKDFRESVASHEEPEPERGEIESSREVKSAIGSHFPKAQDLKQHGSDSDPSWSWSNEDGEYTLDFEDAEDEGAGASWIVGATKYNDSTFHGLVSADTAEEALQRAASGSWDNY